MENRQELPNSDQLSIVAAVILVGYLLLPYLEIPARQITINLFNLHLFFEFQFTALIAFLLASLAAVGSSWLIQSHPRYEGQSVVLYTVLPALSAWVISIPLSRVEIGLQWWVLFILAAAFLIAVLTAEYISLDPSDERHAFATMGLTALSFALYLFLAISISGAGLRLYAVISTLGIAIFPIALRTLNLRLNGQWHFEWALGITLVVAQFAFALHYLPLSPILFGMIMLTFSFTLVNLAEAFIQGTPLKNIWIESGTIAILLILLGVGLNLIQ